MQGHKPEGHTSPRPAGRQALRHLAERVAVLGRKGGRAEETREHLAQALDTLHDALSPPFPDLPGPAMATLALALDDLARQPGRETAHKAFACLCRLGRFGLALTATLLRQGVFTRQEALAALAPLDFSSALGLANLLLLAAGHGLDVDPAPAFDMLAQAAGADPEEARPFLETHGDVLPPLAHPLREALWEGRIGRAAQQAAGAGEAGDAADEAGAWVELLQPEEGCAALAGVLAGAGRVERACRLLISGAGRADLPGRTMSQLLSTARIETGARCLLAVLSGAPDKAPSAAAMLFQGRPELRPALAGALALFDARRLESFLARLEPPLRQEAAPAALWRILAADPVGLSRVAPWLEDVAAAAGAAIPHGAVQAGLDRPPELQAGEAAAEQGVRKARDSGLLGFFRKGPPGRAEFFGLDQEDDLPGRGKVISDKAYDAEGFRHRRVEGAIFLRCRFTGVLFSGVVFVQTSFKECVFEGCSLEGASFWGCALERCGVNGCSFPEALLRDTACRGLDVLGSSFSGARFSRVTLSASRLRACDFTRARFDGLEAKGAGFETCLFDEAVFWRCVFATTSFPGSQARNARAWDLSGGGALLSAVAWATLREELSGAPVPAAPAAVALDGARDGEQAARALTAWINRRDRLGRLHTHLAENDRRMAFGRRVLGPSRARFLTLLPLLLHSDCFDQAAGIFPLAPPCLVTDYHPDLETLELAAGLFPDIEIRQPPADALAIEGVYTIGSFGTLAQTEGSDLDLWICHEAGPTAESDIEGLEAKLAALEEWAGETFGLEVHFYLMDMARVRANDFGVSHEEGSGSAQAMLLKEEFYRTAVLVAGRPLLWWAAPPGASEADWDALARDPELAACLADLGRIGEIPGDEYFGASLWQIFKSIGAPYKSVMKIGLLERYAQGLQGQAGLLCESIKEALLRGGAGLWEIDPYARLFTEVHAHYQGQDSREETALIRLAFLAKTGLAARARTAGWPVTWEESQFRRMYFSRAGHGPSFGGKGGEALGGFREQARLGEHLSRFIVRSYTRLADRLAALGGQAITPEDMTRLGRRIMAAFSKRRNKVEIAPFAEARSRACQVVYFSATRGEKNSYVWRVQAGQAAPGESRMELVLARESRDLPAELAWLVGNGVFGPGTQVSGDYTINPVTAKDLQDLLDALAAFFPQHEILKASTADALNPESVAKAFLAVNLTLPRETRQPRELAVFYLTTWGELFVRTARPRALPPYEPRMLVRAVSDMDCSPGFVWARNLPARAACVDPFVDEIDD